MPKEEWGVKRICPATGKRFYDLNKDPIVSPYTGEVVNFETTKNKAIQADKPDAQNKAADQTEDDADVILEDDDAADVEIDDDLLDDDEDEYTVNLDEITDVAAEESED